MDTGTFIDEIARRLTDYIHSKDEPGQVNPGQPMNSLRRVLDVQVPVEGHGTVSYTHLTLPTKRIV